MADPDEKVWQYFNRVKREDRVHNPDGGAENLFCLDGWIMMGPAEKAWQPVLTAHLVAVPITTFCVFEAPTLPLLGGVNVLLIIMIGITTISLWSLFLTSTSDPGVYLRSTDKAVAAESDRRSVSVGWMHTSSLMDGKLQDMKFCRTCKIFRTPRTTHCGICGNCVEGFDHHCPWVGTCVGERNYREFCIFVFSTAIVLLYAVVLSIWQIARDDGTLSERLHKHWAAMFCACYGCLFSLFIEVLAACHCCLICKGVTTKEWYDLCPESPCDGGPLEQGICFAILCTLCLRFKKSGNLEGELDWDIEGRHDPCDKVCKCFGSCCRVFARRHPPKTWSFSDRWQDVAFPQPSPCDTPADVPNNPSRASTPSVPSARVHAGYANANAAVANSMERDVRGSAVAAVRV